MNDFGQLWEDILSRDPELVENSFRKVEETDQQAILDHLGKMAIDTGWHVEQKHSAQIALDIIARLSQK